MEDCPQLVRSFEAGEPFVEFDLNVAKCRHDTRLDYPLQKLVFPTLDVDADQIDLAPAIHFISDINDLDFFVLFQFVGVESRGILMRDLPGS